MFQRLYGKVKRGDAHLKNMFKFKLVIFIILYCTISQKIFAHILGTDVVEKYQFRPYMTYFHLFYDGQSLPETVDVLETLGMDSSKSGSITQQ